MYIYICVCVCVYSCTYIWIGICCLEEGKSAGYRASHSRRHCSAGCPKSGRPPPYPPCQQLTSLPTPDPLGFHSQSFTSGLLQSVLLFSAFTPWPPQIGLSHHGFCSLASNIRHLHLGFSIETFTSTLRLSITNVAFHIYHRCCPSHVNFAGQFSHLDLNNLGLLVSKSRSAMFCPFDNHRLTFTCTSLVFACLLSSTVSIFWMNACMNEWIN